MTLQGPKMLTSVPGPKAKALLEEKKAYTSDCITIGAPTIVERGEGALMEDVDGNVFLDFVGGIGVLNIGYSNPEVVKAVQDQAAKFFHTAYNVVLYKGYIDLCEKIAEILPGPSKKKVMLINAGTEAIENAVKIARLATGKSGVICFEGAFHGRTYMALSLTSKVKYKHGLGPFMPGVTRIPYPYCYRCPYGLKQESCNLHCAERLNDMFKVLIDPDDTAAMVIECLQGEGGFIPAPEGYLKRVHEILKEHNILLIVDEIQSGFCRTGKWFCHEHYGIEPDIVTMAKSLAGGMPLSAVAAKADIFDKMYAGSVGGTYAGNPLSCAAALKVIEIFERDDYPAKSRHIGEICRARFEAWQKEFPERIGDVRGLGGMIGIEFVKDSKTKEPDGAAVAAIKNEALQNGLILLDAGVNGNIIRILVPLCISDEQLTTGLDIMEAAVKKVLK